MAYDDVIEKIGEFGRYQRKVYILLCLPVICCAFHKLAGVFLSGEMKTRCLLPDEDATNATYSLPSEVLNAEYTWDSKINNWSQCTRKKTHNDTVACESYVYDRTQYTSTTRSQWDLVCDKAWLKATGDSLFMVGVMFGSTIFGYLSDKYGRRPIFFLSLVIQLVGGFLVSVSPEYVSYVIFRMIVGAATSGVYLVAYVIALEMVGPKKRSVAGVCYQLFFTVGYLLTGGLAALIKDWRILQITITFPSVAFLSYWWFIPESVRWLLANGRTQNAKDLLEYAASKNCVDLSVNDIDILLQTGQVNRQSDTTKPKPSVIDLFRYTNLRRKSLMLFFNWLVVSGTYYGLSWQSPKLGGNHLVAFEITGLVEIPAYVFLIFALHRWGRKTIICGSLLVSGLALITTIFPSRESPWLIVCVAIGKLAITSSYSAIYVFTAEQFPTVVRNVGLGACSTFARIGGVIAPHINELGEIWKPLPFVIYGSCAFSGGAMSLLLPETLNKKTPETILDGEEFGKKIKENKHALDIKQLTEINIINTENTRERSSS